jgi:murein DD-endopeptidase MepM/ murein hydrolase activator NlpD
MLASGKVRLWTALAVGSFAATAALAQYTGAVAPILGSRTAGFFDPAYLAKEGVQHLGVDIGAKENADVRSPVDGSVVLNNTWASDINEAYIVIKGPDGEYVLGHIASNLAAGATVSRNQVIGKVRPWGRRTHVHFGINRKGVSQAMVGKWGWGRAPADATAKQATSKGWVNF